MNIIPCLECDRIRAEIYQANLEADWLLVRRLTYELMHHDCMYYARDLFRQPVMIGDPGDER